MIKQYGILRKEMNILSEHLFGAFAVQILLFAVIAYITNPQYFYSVTTDNARHYILPKDWMPKLQLAISTIIALVAAGYFWAEEVTGNHHFFLSRIPVSKLQLYSEKVIAGILIILFSTVLQYVFFVIPAKWGMMIWDINDPTLLYILTVSLSAYVIGIAISLHIKQIIGVIIGGLAVVYGIQFCFMITENQPTQELVFYYLFLLSILFLSISFGLLLLKNRWLHVDIPSWTPPLLFRQQQIQNSIFLLAILITLASMLTPSQPAPGMPVPNALWMQKYDFLSKLAAFILLGLSAASGLFTYNSSEKDGIRNLLYHHPVSLHQLYWYRFFYGLVVALPCSLGLAIIAFHKVSQPSSTTTTVFLAFLSGLFLYTNAVACTHLSKSQIYVFLISCITALLNIPFMANFMGYNLDSIFIGPMMARTLPIDFIPYDGTGHYDLTIVDGLKSMLWIIGSALIGWRLATDRSVLTGSSLYRFGYFCRLFLFMQCIILILLFTGFRDLFYLLTRIDLGLN